VAGRMRVRQNSPATSGNTAGIWFYQQVSAEDRAFVGMVNDNNVGLYGSEGAGWGMQMNVFSGNVVIGGAAPNIAKFGVNNPNTNGRAVYATNRGTQATLVARNNSSNGPAGQFHGSVVVSGQLSKSSGSFRIDHPLDPANKYLYHSFVESPDMMNIYNGNIVTDDQGYAVVIMPDWFEALNREFRYQLTVLDEEDSDTFVQAKVVRKIDGNEFALRTSEPNVEVSWQVTGVRKDAWAEAHRIPVEEEKPRHERGKYTHPALFGQPEEMGIDYVPRSQATDEIGAETLDE